MSCINRNVFYLREGKPREFPTTLESLNLAYDLISIVWKIKVNILSLLLFFGKQLWLTTT